MRRLPSSSRWQWGIRSSGMPIASWQRPRLRRKPKHLVVASRSTGYPRMRLQRFRRPDGTSQKSTSSSRTGRTKRANLESCCRRFCRWIARQAAARDDGIVEGKPAIPGLHQDQRALLDPDDWLLLLRGICAFMAPYIALAVGVFLADWIFRLLPGSAKMRLILAFGIVFGLVGFVQAMLLAPNRVSQASTATLFRELCDSVDCRRRPGRLDFIRMVDVPVGASCWHFSDLFLHLAERLSDPPSDSRSRGCSPDPDLAAGALHAIPLEPRGMLHTIVPFGSLVLGISLLRAVGSITY